MEILEECRDGLVVLNGDDNLLYGLKGFLNKHTVYYGMDEGLDYQAYNIQNAGESGVYFDISIKGKEYKIHVPIPGYIIFIMHWRPWLWALKWEYQ